MWLTTVGEGLVTCIALFELTCIFAPSRPKSYSVCLCEVNLILYYDASSRLDSETRCGVFSRCGVLSRFKYLQSSYLLHSTSSVKALNRDYDEFDVSDGETCMLCVGFESLMINEL